MIDYSTWSREQLIEEVQMLREANHQLSREGVKVMIENSRLKKRVNGINNIRAFFHGGRVTQ